MGFYDLSKEEREKLVNEMKLAIELDLKSDIMESILKYAADSDTYIRKNTYLILGRLHRDWEDIR